MYLYQPVRTAQEQSVKTMPAIMPSTAGRVCRISGATAQVIRRRLWPFMEIACMRKWSVSRGCASSAGTMANSSQTSRESWFQRVRRAALRFCLCLCLCMSTSQFWFVFHQLLPLLGIPNSFSPAPKLFSTVYGTLAVVRDKFFFGGSSNQFFRCVLAPLCVCACLCVCLCACVPVCLCAHMLVRRPLPRRVVHAHKAAVFVSISPNTTLLGSLHVHRFDLATGAFDGLTLEANRNAQLMGFDGQNVCVSDSTGKAQCFKGELHCSVNGVVNGAFSLAVWPASSLACSLVLWGR